MLNAVRYVVEVTEHSYVFPNYRIGNCREVHSKLIATNRGFSLIDGNGLLVAVLDDVFSFG